MKIALNSTLLPELINQKEKQDVQNPKVLCWVDQLVSQRKFKT